MNILFRRINANFKRSLDTGTVTVSFDWENPIGKPIALWLAELSEYIETGWPGEWKLAYFVAMDPTEHKNWCFEHDTNPPHLRDSPACDLAIEKAKRGE